MKTTTPQENSTGNTTILVADVFDPHGLETLQALGHEVISEPGLTADSLTDAIRKHSPEVLVVRSTKVNRDAIIASPSLELIVRAGAGTDNIDVEAASARGIFVSNCPGRNSIAVAELAWGLILSCDRRIPDQVADLRAGIWKKKEYAKSAGLHGKTLGIVGLGRIGQEIAHRGRAFGMNVIAWGRKLDQLKADEMNIDYCESLLNLMKMSDVVTVNVSANSETQGIVNEECIFAMKPGSTLINTSRGSVIDQKALAQAIDTLGIKAGLDVFANEPAAGDNSFTDDIVERPCVYGTHHVGASTEQAQKAIADKTVEIIRTHLESGETINCVNLACETGTTILTVRHLNTPGVLSHVFDCIGESKINVEEMENIIYRGGEAACAKIRLSASPSHDELKNIRANTHILTASITPIV